MSDERGWLVELGSMPPQWWTGRSPKEFSTDPNAVMRFARRVDAECAISWLVAEGTRDGCKATDHLWMDLSTEERTFDRLGPSNIS